MRQRYSIRVRMMLLILQMNLFAYIISQVAKKIIRIAVTDTLQLIKKYNVSQSRR